MAVSGDEQKMFVARYKALIGEWDKLRKDY